MRKIKLLLIKIIAPIWGRFPCSKAYQLNKAVEKNAEKINKKEIVI